MFNAFENPSLYALILAPIKVYGNSITGVNFLQCMVSEMVPGTPVVPSRVLSRIMNTLRTKVPKQLTDTQ